jgi:flagellar hook-associated protein FlgK
MLVYQRGYESIARFVTTFDEMLDVIINRMGV